MDFARLSVIDLKSKIEGVKEIKKKTLYVFDQIALLQKSKAIKPPFAGVIYDGLFSTGPKSSGLNATLQCSIMIAGSGQLLNIKKGHDDDSKDDLTELLDDIRNCIRGTNSPTGHKWLFVSEEPVPVDIGLFFYLQRWQTTAILTQ